MNPADICFALEGPSALSAFRAERLLARLRDVAPVESVRARYVHFLHAEGALGDDARSRLSGLLDYGEPFGAAPVKALELLVVPRIGTISPWASKA
ncbi:MAG TPA: hypothetical protein VFR86_19350, partial [Burkholderiaceae bacterium]|nr:hypothetical protein [Burkholderiaceae bacterium]